MQLSFLGQPYTASTTVADVLPTGDTAMFMGKPYARKQFTVTRRQQPVALTYRGVRYAN
ncbi:DUF4278 domain-containing protein [Nodosilinea sp. P-1105]|uniref:DUF4278 domain-containing protein n=1 Tax=Nodosilinea sp. P-1105 TaxID=2546229 RepID=UPI00146D76BB|nr:DUF4278 domain-containing protein [Nodosilinea sp. P-1105]NMF86618.1 DUF4278 domain-containing protein [Nodosilinea sp. P-1105]